MKSTIQTIWKNKAGATIKDVVGLEIGAGHPQGVPAVRLHLTNNQTELLAAGFIKLDDTLPLTPESIADPSPTWVLPREFQAPKAAIAVTSPMAILRQTSDTGNRDERSLSLREASLKTDSNHPPIVSTMPDFLASWVAGRFPQGHRPTTRSIQTSLTAAINCFTNGPVPQESDKPSIAVFCFKHHSSITAFFDGNLVLYREHPIGYMTIKEEIGKSMSMDLEMVDTLMDDPVVDISSIIEAPLNTLFRQIDISADYLSRRKNCIINDFYVYGLPCGVNHWTTTFKKMIKKPLHHLHPFGGISCSNKKLLLPDSFEQDAPLFTTAIGAARALLEDL